MGTGKKWTLFAVLFSIAFFCITCSKKSSTGPSDTSSDEIKTGPAVTYQVSGGSAVSVKDSVSGTTFVFPNGGSGTLSVATVISGPEVGIPATRLSVQYTGSGEMAISVPHAAGNEEIVYIFSKLPNVSVEGANAGDPAWLGVLPSEQKSDATIFTLSSTAGGSGKRAQTGPATATVAIATATAESEALARRTEARNRVSAAVAFWVNNLPAALADSARNRINNEIPCHIAWSSDGNCYDHTNSTIYLQVDGDPDLRANAHTCAHEVGHYMTHILAGYDRYVEILDRMPKTWYGAPVSHGFAEYFEFRKYVVEEYAFLSDYLITGTVDANDLTKPSVSTMFGSGGPDAKDFPSFEGYGSIMLGALLRKTSDVNSVWWKTAGVSKAPVVGASIGDVLALTARGARDTNELYCVIQDYLTARGYEDRFKLPAMLEPLGWSYHGTGKIVDSKGNPIQSAIVQSCTQNGSGEFRTTASKPTGADGKFTLTRIFPGTNLLRVFATSGKDSIAFQLTADSTKTTNTAIDIGTLAFTAKPSTKQLVLNGTEEIKFGDTLVARVKTTVTADVTGYEIQPNSIQTTAGLDLAPGMPSSVKITASATIEMVNSKVGGESYYSKYSYAVSKILFSAINYSSATLKESRGDNWYSAEFTFPSSTDALQFNTIVQVDGKEERYDNGALQYTLDADRSSVGPSCYVYAKR